MSAQRNIDADGNLTVLCDRDAEDAVLGSCLINPEQFPLVKAIVSAEDFYIHRNGWIFAAMDSLWSRHEAIDGITVADELGPERLKEIGGRAYLTDLVNVTVSSMNAESYARIVAELALRRRMLRATQIIANAAFKRDWEQSELVSFAQRELGLATAALRTGRSEPIGDPLKRVLQKAIDRSQGEALPGIPTGLPTLDQMLGGGLQPGHLIAVSGNAGAGKTAFMLSIGLHAARTVQVRMHSMEMTSDELAVRAAALETGINSQAIHAGQLRDDEWPLLEAAVKALAPLPFQIVNTVPLTVADMRAGCLQEKTDLLLVDYAGLVKSRGEKEVDQQQALSRDAKNLARELNIPLMMAVQLNRRNHEMESPQMQHMRGSSTWETDPDEILVIYPRKDPGRGPGLAYRLEIIKHRNGPKGCINLRFKPETTMFEEE